MHQPIADDLSQSSTADSSALIDDPQFGVPYRPAEAILSHPDFAKARSLYLRNMLDLYGDDPFLNKLLLEAARQIVFGGAICLLAAHVPEDRSTWPTLSNLKRLLRPFGLSSDRRIEQLVARLVSVGYLTQEPAADDRRVRLLIPSQLLLRHDEDWLVAHYRPLDLLYPGSDYALPLARDRAFQLAQRRVSFAFIPRSALVLMSNPDILLFASRDAGFLVLGQLMLDAEAGVHTSFDQFAQRFAISRTHVRQLLRDAEQRDLLQLSHRGGRNIVLRPALWRAVDRFVADGMSGHDLTGAVARKALAENA